MEIIHELEGQRRGPYCGSIGWLGWNGAMDTNIVIRTILRNGNTLTVQTGGGIVADSTAESEYTETINKASALLSL